MLAFLRLFRQFRDLEARVANAEKAMEDYVDEAHDSQVKLELLQESERRMFDAMQVQQLRREDWWAMNSRLAPIHFATPDHPQAPAPPDLTPITGKRLAREACNEAWERAARDLERQMAESTGVTLE